MTMLMFIVLPILIGVIAYTLPKISLRIMIFITEVTLLSIAVYTYLKLADTNEIRFLVGAETSVMGILLKLDNFTLTLITLSVLLFLCSFVYTMNESFFNKKFVMLFLILQGLLCGVFMVDDLFSIYVLLEVATVVVAILIMFKRDSRSTYDGMIYLMSQIICMLFYLFGVGYMYKIFGVLSIEKIAVMIPNINPSQLVLPFSFIMSAICLKSAFFPLFSWLPHAHGTPSAPSAVSAILSGLYVKNGIYLFYVFYKLFYPIVNQSDYFTYISVATALFGVILALSQTDLKLILAFHTISQIGLIALGLTIPNTVSNVGALYHIICHALFKSLLFLTGGMIIEKYKTRDLRQIHGVMKSMPIVGFTTLFAILGITGAPFFNGSISKYYIQYGAKDTALEPLLLLINMGTILSFVKYSHILWGNGEKIHYKDFKKKVIVTILALFCLLGGIFGSDIINFIFDVELSIDANLYSEKAITYAVMMMLAFIIYRYVISRTKFIYKINKFSLNFHQIILSIIIFFITTVTVMSYIS